MEQTKNYSLLRPFDLEAAKRGEPILWIDHPIRWVALSDKELRMAPLCWVEGRPVYKGDVLYRPGINDGPVVALEIGNEEGDIYLSFEDDAGSEFADNRRGYLTWADPNPVLCEVEGKPVRKGDRLWSNFFKRWFTVTGKVGAIKEASLIDEQDCYTLASSCSWKRKVVKHEMFQHANDEDKTIYNTLDVEQKVIKVLANAFYGAFGQNSFHFYNPVLGPSVN